MKKPFIARDTGEPLVVLGGYQVAEDGGLLRESIADRTGDRGHNGMRPDGMFEMVPSGDIVTAEEMERRLR